LSRCITLFLTIGSSRLVPHDWFLTPCEITDIIIAERGAAMTARCLSIETSPGNSPRQATAVAGDGLPVSLRRDNLPRGYPGRPARRAMPRNS